MNSKLAHQPLKKTDQFQSLSKKACLDALTWLATTFPEAFDTESQVRPLKIGIIDDIFTYFETHQIESVSKSKIRQALVMFTRRMEYLVCLKCCKQRIDLEGKPAGPVTDKDRAAAAQTIKEQVDSTVQQKHSSAPEKSYPPRAAQQPEEAQPYPRVIVKRKLQRNIDPEAVARLKAKLGIAK